MLPKTLMVKKNASDTSTNILPSWGNGAVELDLSKSAFWGCDTSGNCVTPNGTEFTLINVVLALINSETGATQNFETKIGVTK